MRVKTLSAADLYGGKTCAALDRYHRRDLFDIKLLLENQGLAEKEAHAHPDEVKQLRIILDAFPSPYRLVHPHMEQ